MPYFRTMASFPAAETLWRESWADATAPRRRKERIRVAMDGLRWKIEIIMLGILAEISCTVNGR